MSKSFSPAAAHHPDVRAEDPDDVDGSKIRSKTPLQDPGRPQRSKTPVDGMGSPRSGPNNNNNNLNKFSGSNSHHRPDLDSSSGNMGRPPPGRPDFFPRYDPRFRDPRANDPFQRSYSSSNAHSGGMEDRWGRENVKPGQFRSRTPGPEMMTRGGPGPDYIGSGRPEMHRPKTPTAADMRSNGRPPFGGGPGIDFRGTPSGRFTPNPSSEQGRQYRHPYQDFGRSTNWPGDFPDSQHRRFEQYENPALNRSYTSDFPRLPSSFQSSNLGGGRPLAMRQSTSFESDQPAPSSITRVPRRPPPHPGTPSPSTPMLAPPRLHHQQDGIPEEEGGHVVEMDVTLHRQESGYGFRIIGGTEEGSQVSVGHIVPGGAADMDGRLRQYDEITHVDGNSVLNASHHRVVQLMTNAALNGRVTLSVRRVLGPESAESMSSIPQYPYDVVVSRRENEGFGFVIISSVNKPGARVDEFIGHIQENSPAARCGRLHVGDRILAVNGVDTSSMHHKDVVALIKDSGFSVALTVGPPPDDSSSSNSQKSSQGSNMNSPGYSADRPDMNINSWERNQPGLQRQRINSSQGSDDGSTGELYQVDLYRGSRGFGFSIRGGREFNAMPLFVLRIAEGGAAHLDGRLAVGDQILEINNISTERMTHTEAIEIIQSGGPSVRLLMRRTNKPPPIFEGLPSSPSGLFPPNIPPTSSSANGPISHSSPHMGRRQMQPQQQHHHHQQLPPPPPDLQLQDDDYYNYPPPPPPSSQAHPQQQVRFNTNY
ncbi:membrane-associated guanylate kinase, ww and pdz domain-containing protein 1 [Plakobranchus ocellatus]|uniref:Membrane-associated guanylate kinase, ww and pdz domain-containing protein 1 n=1 Tax=Plakobranchus ocellatus TaxID=259542 RepID=A0AAV4DIJ3_9GAST|nr:membrane-associated guanylate kinase, ww and pdz domain-containing protein 1 [Plakobranchus ocellatus]